MKASKQCIFAHVAARLSLTMRWGWGYKDIDDYAVTVKLRLVDEPNTSLLIWTTTPWTLLGNAAAAVKADATYIKIKGWRRICNCCERFSLKIT